MKVNSSEDHPLFNCGKRDCGICSKAYSKIRTKNQITKENFSSEGIAPFVGRFGYPKLNIGILAPPEVKKNSWILDAPRYWAHKNIKIPQLVDYRSSLLNSKINIDIRTQNKFLELNQEVSMSSNPVDVDINLVKKPSFKINYDSHMALTGPQAKLKKAKLTENAKIHTKVQKVHYDTDRKASDALTYLYDNNFDENFLSKIFSVGTLGIGKNRKLVPTRWSITATDDTLGKHLLNKVKDYAQINYTAFFGRYLGDFYLILFFPEVWSYELMETLVKKPSFFKTDHELYAGRKDYASNTAGGYYTVKLAILEKLNSLKRQGTALALRFISGDYTLPLGVWVTREAARKSLEGKGIEFSSKELMLEFSEKLIKKKFSLDVDSYFKKSLLLNQLKTQSKLIQFM